ncbi:MAG TPA: nucleotidyltransferase domain-containing protein [Tepidisphaeraceae bacterium]|nr:nucleotidyltransferase domain-containing protein [Tepidisphaeraceae bacterium]
MPRIPIDKQKLAEFCRRNRIRKLSLYGSVLREDFRPDSDVDVLVEFEPDTRLGLRYFHIEQELSDMLGREVEMRTPDEFGKYIKVESLGAEVQYEQA